MEELKLFPEEASQQLQLLFVAYDKASHKYAFDCLNKVRAAGISSELYPEPVKIQKQMKYANARKIRYVVIVGSNEMETKTVTLKNMENGQQQTTDIATLIEQLT